MQYLYGEFSDLQIQEHVKQMHNDIHKLLRYKDPKITEKSFVSDDDFKIYFENLMMRFGGFNTLLGEPQEMVDLMSTLRAAFDDLDDPSYDFRIFRHLILDAHGYLTKRFGEVR